MKIRVAIFLKVRSGEIMPRQSRIDKLGALNYIIFISPGAEVRNVPIRSHQRSTAWTDYCGGVET